MLIHKWLYYNKGTDVVWFIDSLVNGNLTELRAFAQGLIDRNIHIGWMGYARCDERMDDDYIQALAAAGIVRSMSRAGNCYDNAALESFGRTLKSDSRTGCGDSWEPTHQNKFWSRREETGEHVPSCWARRSAAWKIFLPIKSSSPESGSFFGIFSGKRLSFAGRRELNGWKISAPSPGILGRKILLVGKFFGD